MSLNIKNERTHALVRELAELTGTSQTSAVEDAVRRRLHELRDDTHQAVKASVFPPEEVQRRRETIARIARQARAETTPEQRALMSDHDALLYDEYGLPAGSSTRRR
jgi:antitoxin VapB